MVQTPLQGFVKQKSGLVVPATAGLPGFQRQGMDQRKKGGATPIAFKGSDFQNSGSSSVSKGSLGSLVVGDVVFVWGGADGNATRTLTTSGGRTWNKVELAWVSPGYNSALYWQILDATDVANAWNFSSACGYIVSAYQGNGATAVTEVLRVNDGTDGNPVRNLGRFTPSLRSRGVVTMLSDRDNTSMLSLNTAGFALRQDRTLETFWECGVADCVSGYTGGSVLWGTTGVGNVDVGLVFEVT